MHPKHFFDQQQNKRRPEINLKIFVIKKRIYLYYLFFHKNPVSLTAWEEDWNRLIFGCIVNPQISYLDYLFYSRDFQTQAPSCCLNIYRALYFFIDLCVLS